jgi:truncated hemoglobin YjbI
MTEAHINNLVTVFYARARAHPTLGPFFETVISENFRAGLFPFDKHPGH